MERRVWLCFLAGFVVGLVLAAAAFSKGTEIVGGPAADELRGTEAFDVIEGRGGNDVIHGLGQGDRLAGERGCCWKLGRGRPGDDVIYGGTGNDVLQGGKGADRLYAGAGEDKLEEGYPSDSVRDLLNGGPGNDVCIRQKPDRTTGCEAVAHYDLKSDPALFVCERGCALLESRYGSDFVRR